MSRDRSKLPKWAQELFEAQERQISDLRTKLVVAEGQAPESRCALVGHTPDHMREVLTYRRDSQEVAFFVGKDRHRVNVQISPGNNVYDQGTLVLRGWATTLLVQPSSSNSLIIHPTRHGFKL